MVLVLAFARELTFQPAATSLSPTVVARPGFAVPFSTKTLSAGSTVGTIVGVGVGVVIGEPELGAPWNEMLPFTSERPKIPRPTSSAVASAAQPKPIQPRPFARGMRCA